MVSPEVAKTHTRSPLATIASSKVVIGPHVIIIVVITPSSSPSSPASPTLTSPSHGPLGSSLLGLNSIKDDSSQEYCQTQQFLQILSI